MDETIELIGRYVQFQQLPYEVWESNVLIAAFLYEEDYKDYLECLLESHEDTESQTPVVH